MKLRTELTGVALLPLLAVTGMAQRGQAAGKVMTWRIDGVARRGMVFAPGVQAAGGKAPLVLEFHGHGGTMGGFANLTHFHTAWPEAIVVSLQGVPIETKNDPEGKKPGWDSGEDALKELSNRDLELVDSVLATIKRQYAVDDRRIYSVGFSNGGGFTFLLWAARPSVFAAFGVAAGAWHDAWGKPVARPVIFFGGKKDPLDKPEIQRATLESVRKLNGNAPGKACGPGCTLYASPAGAPLRAISHNGGHEYPPFATDEIVTFFKNHPLGR